jgi:hypothetical protein
MVDNWSDEARRHPVPPQSDRGPKGSGASLRINKCTPHENKHSRGQPSAQSVEAPGAPSCRPSRPDAAASLINEPCSLLFRNYYRQGPQADSDQWAHSCWSRIACQSFSPYRVARFGYCMAHVVLLGDSIFDNSAYVGGPDVVRQLQARLPAGSSANLAARDGARISDMAPQIDRIAPMQRISS